MSPRAQWILTTVLALHLCACSGNKTESQPADIPDVAQAQDTPAPPDVQDTAAPPNVQDTAAPPDVQDTAAPPDVQDTTETADTKVIDDTPVVPPNTPPSAPSVAIEPQEPGVNDALTCAITDPSVDPDPDQIVVYTYGWERNGEVTEHTKPVLPADATALWDDWVCRVVPNDGIDDGAAGSADVHVLPGAQFDQKFSETLDDIQSKMADKGVPGAAVSIVLGGKLAYSSGLGVKKLGTDDPVTSQDLFCLQSISKPLTAAAAMALMDAGTLVLDSPVSDYLPFFVAQPPYDIPEMTVRHLLTHTAGYPNYFGADKPTIPDYTDPNALKAFHEYYNPTSLWFPPGDVWNYSNLGYGLAGLILEGATGKYYAEVLADTLFDPLGITATSGWDPAATADYAVGHSTLLQNALEPVSLYWFDNVPLAPYARVFASVDDLAHFAEMLLSPTDDVLTSTSKQTMVSPQVATHKAPDEHFGIGFFLWDESRHGVPVVSHGGSGLGYAASFLMVPEAGFASVVLANHDGFYDVTSLNIAAMKRFLDLPDIPKIDYKTDPATWTQYTGTYLDPVTLGKVKVWMAGQALGMTFVQLKKTVTLIQMAADHFIFKGPAGHPTLAGKWISATFFVDDQGKGKYIATNYGVAVLIPNE
jgi:CubicO group peptidase (beta-lactamase class C family)